MYVLRGMFVCIEGYIYTLPKKINIYIYILNSPTIWTLKGRVREEKLLVGHSEA